MYRITLPGRWFLSLTLLLFLDVSLFLDWHIAVPFIYAAVMWVVAWLVAMIYPPKVRLNADLPTRVAVGASAPVSLRLKSISKSPMVEITVLPMRLPPFIDVVPEEGVKIQELLPNDEATVSLTLICRKRGLYILKGYRVETAYPTGLLRAYSSIWQSAKLLVYPTFQPLSHITLPAGSRYHPGGVALASKIGDSMEYIGNREYREGDNVRDIDWRATARLTKPIVREYREEYFYRVGVIQDTFLGDNRSSHAADFERSISICAAVSDYMSREEYIVDLFAAGPNLYHLTAGRSLAFQDQMLDILACLEPAALEPFQIIEPELMENLSKLTIVICILLDWDPVRRNFVDRIRRISDVKVIVVRDANCTLDPAFDADSLSISVIDRKTFEAGAPVL